MAIPQTLYTGRDTGVRLDDGGRLERSMGRMSERMMGAAKAQADFSKEERDAFLEALDTETVALMSEKLLGEQAAQIQQYNETWGQRHKDRGGKLTMQDKVEMAAHKKRLEGWQKRAMADQERWKTDKAMVLRNPNYYDKNAFYDAEKNYFETGEYGVDALQARPVGLSTAIANQRTRTSGLRARQETRIQEKGGAKWRVPYESTADLEDPENQALMKAWTEDLILSDEGVMRGVMRDFNKLGVAEKKQVLDVNKDGVISPDERANDNPIIQWAVENNWRKWAVETYGTPTRITEKKADDGRRYKIGSSYFDATTEHGPVEHQGGVTFTDEYQFGKAIPYQVTLPADVTKVLSEFNPSLTGNVNTKVQIVGYDAATDQFIATLTENLEQGTIFKGTNVSVPSSAIPQARKDIKIVRDGKVLTIEELAGQPIGSGVTNVEELFK